MNYSFSPAGRSFSLLGAHTEASFTASTNGQHLSPLGTPEYFVRQQYLDFLGRMPDSFGFPIWLSTLANCPAGDISCDRVHVSEQFVRSAEFQQRGYFTFRFYPVSFPGTAGIDPSGFGRKPTFAEFLPDLRSVSGFLDANQLEAAKVAFVNSFMARPAFVARYNSLDNTQYVDTLLNTAGVTSSNRLAMINGLNNSTLTRAVVLRQIVESTEVANKYHNESVVVMQYFGYLRRDPDALYLNWLAVLDANPSDSRHGRGFPRVYRVPSEVRRVDGQSSNSADAHVNFQHGGPVVYRMQLLLAGKVLRGADLPGIISSVISIRSINDE